MTVGMEQDAPTRDRSLDVWVIEDNPVFRKALVSLLEEAPSMRCALAEESCEPAIAAAEAGHLPDVVLMDLGLPGMGGLEGTRRLKSIIPTADVVILTIHEDSDKVFDAICAGASGYLLKPSSSETILDAVRAVRSGAAVINPAIARKVLSLFARLAEPQSGAESYGLTSRERQILQLLVDGLTTRQIAGRLEVSFHTVDTHIRNIYSKLHVHNRGGAVAKAVQERLI